MDQKLLRILFVNASPGQVEAWRQVGQVEVVGPIYHYLPVDTSTTDLPAYNSTALRLYNPTRSAAPDCFYLAETGLQPWQRSRQERNVGTLSVTFCHHAAGRAGD